MILKNSISNQSKKPGDNIESFEWNNIINQLRLQCNYSNEVIDYFSNILVFKWEVYKEDFNIIVGIINIPDGEIPFTEEEDIINFLNDPDNNYAPEKYKLNLIEYEGKKYFSYYDRLGIEEGIKNEIDAIKAKDVEQDGRLDIVELDIDGIKRTNVTQNEHLIIHDEDVERLNLETTTNKTNINLNKLELEKKLFRTELDNYVYSPTWDPIEHIITFPMRNALPLVIDLPSEWAFKNVKFEDNKLIFTLENGETVEVPITDLLDGMASEEWTKDNFLKVVGRALNNSPIVEVFSTEEVTTEGIKIVYDIPSGGKPLEAKWVSETQFTLFGNILIEHISGEDQRIHFGTYNPATKEFVSKSVIGSQTGLNMGNQKITNTADGTQPKDVVVKSQLDLKANDTEVIKKEGNQIINGVKDFQGSHSIFKSIWLDPTGQSSIMSGNSGGKDMLLLYDKEIISISAGLKKLIIDKDSGASFHSNLNMVNNSISDLKDGTKPKDAINLSQLNIADNIINTRISELDLKNVKKVNNKLPNSVGELVINIGDVPQLNTELNKKVSVTTFNMQMLEKLSTKPNGDDLLIIDGKINPLYIDPLEVEAEHPIVNSELEMLSLEIPTGSVVVRTDLNNDLFILVQQPATQIENWQIVSPNNVISVAGRQGAIVLGITDINGLTQALNLKLDALTFVDEVQRLENLLDAKVEKVTGKGLSTNDYTTAEKNKLTGIEEGAQKNVGVEFTQTEKTKLAGVATGADKTPVLKTINGTVITGTGNIITPNTTYAAATTSVDGLMSSIDKVKLNAIEPGAQKNPNFKTINGEDIVGTGNIQIQGGDGGGVPEAPNDGLMYGRKENSWEYINDKGNIVKVIEVIEPSVVYNNDFAANIIINTAAIYDFFEIVIKKSANSGNDYFYSNNELHNSVKLDLPADQGKLITKMKHVVIISNDSTSYRVVKEIISDGAISEFYTEAPTMLDLRFDLSDSGFEPGAVNFKVGGGSGNQLAFYLMMILQEAMTAVLESLLLEQKMSGYVVFSESDLQYLGVLKLFKNMPLYTTDYWFSVNKADFTTNELDDIIDNGGIYLHGNINDAFWNAGKVVPMITSNYILNADYKIYVENNETKLLFKWEMEEFVKP